MKQTDVLFFFFTECNKLSILVAASIIQQSDIEIKLIWFPLPA